MLDLIFIVIIAGFFVIALAYIVACDRLRKGAKEE
jgi:hypothetical protein